MRQTIRNIKIGVRNIVAHLSIIVPQVGNYARNTADACILFAKGLDNSHIKGNVIYVMAASPQGAGTFCLYRYPSPYGRSCVSCHRPPFFYVIKQRHARISGAGIGGHRRVLSGLFQPQHQASTARHGRNQAISGHRYIRHPWPFHISEPAQSHARDNRLKGTKICSRKS